MHENISECPRLKDYGWPLSIVIMTSFVKTKLRGGGGGGTGDFKVSRHVSKQITTAQKLYTRSPQVNPVKF